MSSIHRYVIDPACAHRYPDGQQCGFYRAEDHVHGPGPCPSIDRHHPYTPPDSITVFIAGKRRRIRRLGASTEAAR